MLKGVLVLDCWLIDTGFRCKYILNKIVILSNACPVAASICLLSASACFGRSYGTGLTVPYLYDVY